MQIATWSVASWQRVEYFMPPESSGRWPRFEHSHTRVQGESANDQLRHGDTLWLGDIDGERVGLAWDWHELRRGVIVQSDTNGVLSNLLFLDQQRRLYVNPLVAIVSLNHLIRHLPWQKAVLDETQQRACSLVQQHIVPKHVPRVPVLPSKREMQVALS